MSSLFIRLGIGLLFSIFALFNYFVNVTENPITGEKQRLQLSPRQEVIIGLQSRQEMAAKHNGLYPDQTLQAYVDQVGDRIVQQSSVNQSSYPFEFHLLRDTQTINAFALPGGQVFITAALLGRLNSEAQLAGVLGHEIAHVVARHGAEHLAKQQLGAALVNAVGIAASDTPESARQAAILAQAVNQMVNLKYGREDELESDRLGFRFMTEAGYNPQGIVELMQILASSRNGQQPAEFFSTHPNPGNRTERLGAIIQENFPNGIPAELEEGQQKFAQIVGSRL
ncbi:peptidase M48 Ste24p [Stanieria cyanosphaera PCC 7437]|uniref:Peptidase M48 Ste24p n=1 Tax=Stanieria cyanosphaera (strain ATCC 29371 / PCC 7437) TaxID=111780 RepID=K9XRJ6_STAC7|nr:M48 family metalloprotease [Stanieria cyanosphaera]AFZ34704.1 peptidase M48 Ste24p [Stanieria cyanosphaera PCC 7437]